MRSSIANNPLEPIGMATEALAKAGLTGANPREPKGAISKQHCDIAAWVQSELERALVDKVAFLIKESGIRNICLAGGVVYNCRAMGVLQASGVADKVYIGPASGDQGQCIGNAFYGSTLKDKLYRRAPISAYLGPTRRLETRQIMKQVAKYAPSLSVTVSSVCEKLAAEELFRGKIGAIYQGRSEFGPRALGNRSIVALPSNLARKFQLNSIKNREAFMPFAPAVLEEKLEKYFEASGEFSFMTTAVMTKEIMHSAAPAAIHVDGTARVQAVSKTLAPRFHALLCAVEDLSGHSLLLNTSFNAGGQPIVESLDDALETFEKLDLGFLWAGDCIIKWKSPNKSKDVWRTFIPVLTVNSVVLRHVNVNSLSKLLLENGVNASICERDLFLLYSEYVGWLKNGRKSTTIRYRKNEVDMPAGATLPLYSSSSVLPDAEVEYFGVVFIQSVAVAQFGDLTNEDAIRDGFKDLSELHKALGRIYGIIEYDELVTIYGIALVPVAA